MASAGMAPASGVGKPSGDTMLVDKLPEEINEMKIKDEKIEKVHLYESADNLWSFASMHLFCYFIFLCLLNDRKWKQLWWTEMEQKPGILL